MKNILLSIPLKALCNTTSENEIYPMQLNLVQISFGQKKLIHKPTSNAIVNNFNKAMLPRSPSSFTPKLYPSHHS